ncbi:hypothetical protein ABT213_30530 [Streptomyces sp. NPDC001674]|uniref:hypothetical protein n=1 Tax=Streptomyces sp. NPDC001674 TaxID=3154394 RepID=UPI00331B180C
MSGLTPGVSGGATHVVHDDQAGGCPDPGMAPVGVNRCAHAAIVGVVKDVLPETRAVLLVASGQWPLLAARMDRIRAQGGIGLLATRTWPA